MKFYKILFWIITIIMGFVNPLISFGLLFVYYLPSLIQQGINLSNPEQCQNSELTYQELKKRYQNELWGKFSKYYSDETLGKHR